MIKKILIVLVLVSASAFAFDWGIYGGPGFSGSMTNMTPVYDALRDPNSIFTGYDVPGISNFQLGLSTPITLRLGNFALTFGDAMAWQTSQGTLWKTSFYHTVNATNFGYIFDIGDHLRLTPFIGIGDYDIRMNVSKSSGGFGDSVSTNSLSVTYDYSNFSLSGGASFAYLWKFENNIIMGLEAKARYIVPLDGEAEWRPRSSDYSDAVVDGFFPATPVVGLSFVIGYEKVSRPKVIDQNWNEDSENGDAVN
jgi:hypothetical protein